MTKERLRENRSTGAIILNMLLAAISLFFNGFGVYLTIQANIGAGPWDVLNLGISKTVGILYGTASIAVSMTILLIDILLREPMARRWTSSTISTPYLPAPRFGLGSP